VLQEKLHEGAGQLDGAAGLLSLEWSKPSVSINLRGDIDARLLGVAKIDIPPGQPKQLRLARASHGGE